MERLGVDVKQKVEGINVFVRLRHPGERSEEEGQHKQVVQVSQGGTCVSLHSSDSSNVGQPVKVVSCAFDRVFGPDSTQQEIFQGLLPALDTILQGFNACVLAYGQTGSGKTHTLIGPNGGTRLAENSSDWGIIPRAVQFLFDRLLAASAGDDTFTFSVTCSFMQIYNENLVDLLQDGVRRRGPSLQIREESAGVVGGGAHGRRHRRACGSAEGGSDTEGEAIRSGRRRPRRRIGLHENRRVFVSGLSSFRVSGAEDVLRYVNLGASNRNVRATQHNEVSSRSHAVMQLVVDSESGGGGEGVNGGAGDGHVTYRQAKLSIVDLAGSEKMDSVLNTSTGHFRELRCINQSLSALGNVVSALSEKGRKHVPYRDSKLTRLLQDSLGGNTRTTIIACVNPLAAHTNETISTLMFAARAKKIMVRIRPNEVMDDRVLLVRAQADIARLKKLLRQALENALKSDDLIQSPAASDTGVPPHANISKGADGAVKGTGSRGETVEAIAGSQRETKLAVSADTTGYPNDRARSTNPTIQTRQIVTLIAENERLREDNSRLSADVQRLTQARTRTKQRRRGGRSVTPLRRVAPPLPIAPFDWGTKYAKTTAQGRRRKSSSSHGRSSSPGQLSFPEGPALPASKTRGSEKGGDDEEGDPVVDDISTGEVRDTIDDDYTTASSGGRDEAENVTRLGVFRSSLKAANHWSEGELNGGTWRRGTEDDIQTFVEESQRLEKLMLEAYRRERQLLREERARLTSSRTERIALEAQLAELTHSVARAPDVKNMPEIANAGVAATAGTPTPAACVEHVCTDHEPISPIGDLPTMHANAAGLGVEEGSHDEARACWVDQTSAAPPIAVEKATPPPDLDRGDDSVSGDVAERDPGPENTAPASELPRYHRQTNWTPPTRFCKTRSGQRPATSVGAVGRARLRRPRRLSSRSPTKHRAPILPIAITQQGEKYRLKTTRLSSASTAKLKVLQASYPSPSPMTTPGDKRLLPRETERCLFNGDKDSTTKSKLAFSAADLGLRLKIYSFRYDHHYECQVIGYDPKRRMHRCAYDASGEKQWHDLANKQFEVVGQNGVAIRSSESAP